MMFLKRKKVILLFGFMTLLSCLYLYDNIPWIWRSALYQVSGFKPASAFYVFEFENQTYDDLIVEFVNLNDRKWHVRNSREKYIYERLGGFHSCEYHFTPGEKKVIVMPSFRSRSMGLICIFGRTDWKTLPSQPNQKFFMSIVPAHVLSGIHPYFNVSEDGYPLVTIHADDLESITPDDVLKMDKKILQLLPQ